VSLSRLEMLAVGVVGISRLIYALTLTQETIQALWSIACNHLTIFPCKSAVRLGCSQEIPSPPSRMV
jgi:hypothetical protein